MIATGAICAPVAALIYVVLIWSYYGFDAGVLVAHARMMRNYISVQQGTLPEGLVALGTYIYAC
jgi:hypothetical protein